MDVQNGSHVHHMEYDEYEHQSHVMKINMFHELMFTFIIHGIFMNIQLYIYFGGTREACLPTSYICWLILLIIYRILYLITINPRT